MVDVKRQGRKNISHRGARCSLRPGGRQKAQCPHPRGGEGPSRPTVEQQLAVERIVPKDFGSYGNRKSRKRPECRLGLCNRLRSYHEVARKANRRGHCRSQSQELRPESGVHLFS